MFTMQNESARSAARERRIRTPEQTAALNQLVANVLSDPESDLIALARMLKADLPDE